MQNNQTTERSDKTESSQEKGPFSAPAIELPKGGGAIRGIDEKFSVNPATGTGSMNIPIATSPGRQGFSPQLALSYDSGAGNGPFGLGWNLSLPSITRKTDKGIPRYQDGNESDVFILSGAEDLVPVLVEKDCDLVRHSQIRTLDGATYLIQRYRPRIEGLFARIERWINQQTDEAHWRSISRDNVTTLYGRTTESRICDPHNPRRIFSWLICESYDDKGNAIVYEYKAEDSANIDTSKVHERNRTDRTRSANRYLKRIRYGNETPRLTNENLREREDWMFDVVFDYGEGHYSQLPEDEEGRKFVESTIEEQQPWFIRQDPMSSYRSGFEVRTYRLCQRVLMFHHFPDELGVDDYLVSSTSFAYNESLINTVMTSVIQSDYLLQEEGTFLKRSLPPVDFEYSEAQIQDEINEIDAESLQNLPVGLDGSLYRWTDLDGEGISGILTQQGTGWFYKPNLGNGRFGPQERVAEKPSLTALNSGQQLLDLAGDGQLDLVNLEGPVLGFYERTHDQSWTSHRPFVSLPSVAWDDPNLRFVDLTGDGHADVLVTEDNVFTMYPSLAEEGYGDGRRTPQSIDDETGPRLLFADATLSIYLADMSGDGLTDLVRIRNGLVCYWPNLGYGNFGSKVTMDNAPWFDTPNIFDQRRIRLADVDGSGISDILYLKHDRIEIYFNKAGNGWSDAEIINHFPPVDNLADITVTDLLGNGTACLVWSSPLPGNGQRQMRYIDLMGGRKPHLMIASCNNLGAETRVQYASSTKFYLADKTAGNPWITRLPFPVHVVERTETYDHISCNRFVTRYSYHHGYFDGVEREFRGFGMVEQIDTEEFVALSKSDTFPTGDNIDEASHIPPVLTRSWFHTGVYLRGPRISQLFQDEYYREPALTNDEFQRQLLPDTVMPAGMTPEAEREAVRALKGAMLRQEVYALDGTEREPHPYTVTEQNFTIKQIQAEGPNRHSVFFTNARESISYHYERNPVDPRVGHSCVLATDEFGNVLQSIDIGYGRRQADKTLSLDDQKKQCQILMTFTENEYTNEVEEDDAYRTPLASEVRTYEVTGLELPENKIRYAFTQLQEAVYSAKPIPYHATPIPGVLQKRLLEQVRTLYRCNDLTGPLPLGELESLAIPFESYQLAFTPEHLDIIFGNRINEEMLTEEGRYVHFDGDINWWIPSGQIFFSATEDDTPDQELGFAQIRFYMPHRFRDPFGEIATVEYDHYILLLLSTTDPLKNTVTSENDYRVLSPRVVKDPNGNRSAVAFDVLGMVAGTAVMGKESEKVGDSLKGFQAQLTQKQIDAFFADPRGPIATELLGKATSRIIYDEARFQRLKQPSFAVIITRESHITDLGDGEESAVQISFAYSDGFGRTIQKKVQAEPGVVEEGGNIVSPRWTTSGLTIFNNKGNPVKQYEPFFSADHMFEFGVTVGVSPTLFYDPVGRVVATLKPNHTWEKIIFDPWRQESWDVNDTVLVADPANDSDVGDYFRRIDQTEYLPTWHQTRIDGRLGAQEQDVARKTSLHADTPGISHFDTLGRPFLSVADNGKDGKYETRTDKDIEGATLRVNDARDNTVMEYQIELEVDNVETEKISGYDVANRQPYEYSMDAGERRVLMDIAGNPIWAWDSRGHAIRKQYDVLRRPTHLFVQSENTKELLAEMTVFGETHPDAECLNLRGRVYQQYDGAGVATNHCFDFKGNKLQSSRQLAQEYRQTVDWSVLNGVDSVKAIRNVVEPFLECEVFTTRTRYDALNRPISMVMPDDSETVPGYNEAGLLERLEVRLRGVFKATPFATNIDYNARGQRERITYATHDGTNFTTSYEYEPKTFRLTRLLTKRHRDGTKLQDLNYTYDPVGNITTVRDNAQQSVFFSNSQVDPHCIYTYDPLYRLIYAEGREHAVQNNMQRNANEFIPLIGIPHPNSPEALQRYVETYSYDRVGNILRVSHTGGANLRWKRCYQYALDNNRLLATSDASEFKNSAEPCPTHYIAAPNLSQRYEYDAHGNMNSMPHLPIMQLDFKDQMVASSPQVINKGIPETTYYVYDAGGQRVRKVTDRLAVCDETLTRKKERIYMGGFEVYREYTGDGETVALERETLHVSDGSQRLALVDTLTVKNCSHLTNPTSVQLYQLSNYLGSAMIEVDDLANVISNEEYHPYGTSAYRAGRSVAEVSLKRYRYTGKERDEETGLYYHGARYYACWLGRWTAVDPIRLSAGTNRFRYGSDNPINRIDPSGTIDFSFELPTLEDVKDVISETASDITETAQEIADDPVGAYGEYLDATVGAYGRLLGERAGDVLLGVEELSYQVQVSVHNKGLVRGVAAIGADLAMAEVEATKQEVVGAVEGAVQTVQNISEGDFEKATESYVKTAKNVWSVAAKVVGAYATASKTVSLAKRLRGTGGTGKPLVTDKATGERLEAEWVGKTPSKALDASSSTPKALPPGKATQKALPPGEAAPKALKAGPKVLENQYAGRQNEDRLGSILRRISDPGSVIPKPKVQTGKFKSQSWTPDYSVTIRGRDVIFDAKLTKNSGRTKQQEHRIPVFEEKGGILRKRGVLPKEGRVLGPSTVREITKEVMDRFERIFGKS